MYISELIDGIVTRTPVDNIEFQANYDVIISGLGTAGAHAAIMSAQNGLKVLGIEILGCLGGTMTMCGIGWHYFGCPGGRYEKIDEEVVEFQKNILIHRRKAVNM